MGMGSEGREQAGRSQPGKAGAGGEPPPAGLSVCEASVGVGGTDAGEMNFMLCLNKEVLPPHLGSFGGPHSTVLRANS